MKKYLSTLFVGTLIVSSGTSFVFAQTTTPVSSETNTIQAQIEQIKENAQTEKEQAQSEITKVRNEAQQKMKAFKTKIQAGKNKIKAQAGVARIADREDALAKFDDAIAKLNTLKDNVNIKIGTLEASGMDVTNAKAQIAITVEKIAEAQAKVADTSTLLSGSLNELSKDNQAQLKQLVEDIQTLVKDAHLALNQAVGNLKEQMQNKIDATTTTETTNQ